MFYVCLRFCVVNIVGHLCLASMLQRCPSIRFLRPLQTRIVSISKDNIAKQFQPYSARGHVRGYVSSSTVSGSTSGSSVQSGLAVFAPLTSELDKICPRFEVDAEDIEVLRGPVEFYEVLKVCDITCCSFLDHGVRL